MHSCFPAIDNAGRPELRQPLEPETGRLRFAVAKLPRLNHLIGLSDPCADDAHWVFESDTRDRSGEKKPDKLQRLRLLFSLFSKPPCSGHGQVSAWRVSYHHIPAITQNVPYVALVVFAWSLRRQQVAAGGVVPQRVEGISYSAGKFAGDKYFHSYKLEGTANVVHHFGPVSASTKPSMRIRAPQWLADVLHEPEFYQSVHFWTFADELPARFWAIRVLQNFNLLGI